MSALLQGVPRRRDGSISVAINTTQPAHYANGLPYEANGALAIDTLGAITHHHQGVPFTAAGRIAAATGTDPDRISNGAMPLLNGRVVFATPATPGTKDRYVHGVGYNVGGRLAGTTAAPNFGTSTNTMFVVDFGAGVYGYQL